jgi:RNA polymerase sigma factor (sigma-70 family)
LNRSGTVVRQQSFTIATAAGVKTVQLVERAASGDRDAFDVLMTDALDRLYAIARLILRDNDLAEDAVQEALIHCWRELPRLRDPERFDAWLHRLLVNAATDQFRRRRRFHASVSFIDDRIEPDFSAHLAMQDEIRVAFERLRMDHRAALVLFHYLGLSVAEIAEALGVPVGTAKSRLHYAAQAMRAAVEAGTRLSPDVSIAEVGR